MFFVGMIKQSGDETLKVITALWQRLNDIYNYKPFKVKKQQTMLKGIALPST